MERIFIFLCMAVAVLAHGSKVHEQMTAEEVQAMFGTKHDGVPNYEVVPVAHAYHNKSRAHRIVQLTCFERDMTLYLEPNDGYLAGVNTPVFRARSNDSAQSGVEYERVHHAITSKHNFYQDPVNVVALVIKDGSNGKPVIDGMIDDLALRPLPERLRGQFRRDKRSARDEFSKSNRTVQHPDLEDTHHHIVFRVPSRDNTEPTSGPAPVKREKRQIRTRNDIPDIIHPQILLVLESSLFKQDVDDVLDYVLSYWNAVDLRYRAFTHPDVRLNIAGIVMAEDHKATPYIANNHVKIAGFQNKIEVNTALRNMSQFYFPETVYDDSDKSLTMERLGLQYDIVIVMTPFDMCQFSPECLSDGNYVCFVNPGTIKRQCTTLGYAYYTGACSYDPIDELMESAGIVEDVGGFSGIIPTAHEVGHLMGASHNAANVNKCPVDDGYLMSYQLNVSPKSFIWSNCSEYSIKKFLKIRPRAQCLFNLPETYGQTPRLLPGKVFSRDEQCDRLVGTRSCADDVQKNTCVQLFCATEGSNDCQAAPYATVPEGSPCGQGQHCINAKCVSESEETVLLELGTKRPRKKKSEQRRKYWIPKHV